MSGQGAWEDGLEEAIAVKGVLDAKKVPCWLDLWGHDVNHNWPWWQRQLPYFLGRLYLPASRDAGLFRGEAAISNLPSGRAAEPQVVVSKEGIVHTP